MHIYTKLLNNKAAKTAMIAMSVYMIYLAGTRMGEFIYYVTH